MKSQLTNDNERFWVLLEFAKKIVQICNSQNIEIRLIGSVGLYYHIFENLKKNIYLRHIKDIDFILKDRKDAYKVIEIFKENGFNYSHEMLVNSEAKRLIFFKENDDSILVDVFSNPFSFAETIDFKDVFSMDKFALSITDIFLTKMQRVNLSENDFTDIAAILKYVELSDNKDSIQFRELKRILCNDWGFYKIFFENIDLIKNKYIDLSLTIEKIKNYLESCPKTTKWKIRSILGASIPYYQNVENIE